MNLLLLTKYFPFGTGEAFIENEIATLATCYDKVVIVACEPTAKDKVVRPLPSNVTAYRVDAPGVVRQKSMDILRGATFLFSSSNKALHDELRNCKSLSRKLFLLYFEGKCRRVYDTICRHDMLSLLKDDAYVLYSYWLFMTARVGCLIMRELPPALSLCRAHRYDLYEERNALGYLPLREHLLQQYDTVLPCSDNGTRYLQKCFPQYASKIHTSLLGTFNHGLCQASTDGVLRIVSCSRIVPVKRIGRILDALVLLDTPDRKIHWTHIGGGGSLEALQKRARQLTHIKTTFTGNMSNAAVLEYYRTNTVDIFLNVSSSEGLPVSIMEAISFGVPTVATDVGGTAEIVVEGQSGILLPKDFTDTQLATAITDPVLIDTALRTRCRELWLSRFQACENYLRLHKGIIANI